MTHLETAVNNWNTEWRFGCEIFEQLEEERIEFFRENLAQYYTLLLENCETKESFDISRQNVLDINVDKELDQFVKDHRSTSTIPNMIDYISFSAATATTDGTTAHTNHTIGTGTGTGTDTDTDTDTDTNPQQDVTRQRFEQTTEHTPRRDPDPRPSKSVLKNKTPEIKQNIRSSQPSKLSQPPQEAPRAMLAHMKIYDWEESDEDQDSDEYQESDIENDNGSDSYSSHDREIARTIAQASKDECHDNHLVTSSPLPMTSSAEPSVDPILDMPSVDANFDDSPRSSSSRVNDELEDMLQQLEKQKKVSSIGSAKGASITSSRYPPRQRPTKNTTTTTTAASGTASAISATKINHLQRNESGRSTSSMESSASDDLFDPVSRKSTAPTLSSVGSGNPLGTSRNTLADLDMNVNPNRQQSPSTGQSRNDLESWRSESMSPSNTGTELTFVDYAIARFDYAAKDEDEISFTKGDLLGIIDKNEDGWWLSRRWEEASGWSEQGCAPNNYLTLVEA
ncbi:hypothetical protein J3Q64DRAFT_1306178 [Phycomyces blakesleeanus]|uniref:SH3 domain-containing protein n=1 Tax=Phycomyces blakesleeanus TaxID=4837 RepID=A0ABR3AM19_PHYBL